MGTDEEQEDAWLEGGLGLRRSNAIDLACHGLLWFALACFGFPNRSLVTCLWGTSCHKGSSDALCSFAFAFVMVRMV